MKNQILQSIVMLGSLFIFLGIIYLCSVNAEKQKSDYWNSIKPDLSVYENNIAFQEDPMQSIYKKVIDDCLKQYEIVAATKDKMQMYVRAGMVAEAYLQAKDAVNYKAWKKYENSLGRKIGIK